MSIMTDARLRLLEARVAEIERQLAVIAGVSAPEAAQKPEPRPAGRSEPRADVQKIHKRSRKTP